jgi:hypothetical protein
MSPTSRRRVISRSPAKPVLNLSDVRVQVDAWYAIKRQAALLTKKLDVDKEALKSLVHRYGETDADPQKGHITLDLIEPVGDRNILKLRNQRAETHSTNEEAARRILGERYHEMSEVVEVLDQDKVWAAYYDKQLTEDEMAQMFPTKVHYSLILLDEDDKPVS